MGAAAIDGKATAVFPLRHRPRLIVWQQAAAHENAQQPLAHLRLDLGDGAGIDPGGGSEDAPPAAAASNTPSMTTQWKCRWGLRAEPKRWCSKVSAW